MIIAQATAAASNWLTLETLGVLLLLGVNFFALVRIGSGKGGERQIEPTQIAALQTELRANHAANQAELRSQTATLHKLDREMGGVTASLSGFQRDIAEVKVTHTQAFEGVHSRLSGISRELAGTTARIESVEKRCPNCT